MESRKGSRRMSVGREVGRSSRERRRWLGRGVFKGGAREVEEKRGGEVWDGRRGEEKKGVSFLNSPTLMSGPYS